MRDTFDIYWTGEWVYATVDGDSPNVTLSRNTMLAIKDYATNVFKNLIALKKNCSIYNNCIIYPWTSYGIIPAAKKRACFIKISRTDQEFGSIHDFNDGFFDWCYKQEILKPDCANQINLFESGGAGSACYGS